MRETRSSSSRVVRSCPLCGAGAVDRIGTVLHPTPTLVAGSPIDLGDIMYSLARCTSCGFQYKDPQIPESRLLDCYAKASADHWEDRPDPVERAFDLVRDALERTAPGPSVLDIGCFNGSLLEFLGARWTTYGVEPSASAAQTATRRGVTILGRTVEDVPRERVFDAAMAIDVVEHIPDPVPFFHAVSERLVRGGVFVVQTGDTDAWTWRLQGSRYWYCSLPEHVSFYNRRSMGALADKCGMKSEVHIRMRHERRPARLRLKELVKNLGYSAGLSVRGLGLPRLRRMFVDRRAPGWLTARDHMLHVMRKL